MALSIKEKQWKVIAQRQTCMKFQAETKFHLNFKIILVHKQNENQVATFNRIENINKSQKFWYKSIKKVHDRKWNLNLELFYFK